TLALALFAALFGYGLGVPLGCALGAGDRKRWAEVCQGALYLAYALPSAAVAMWLLRAGAPFGGEGVGGRLPPALCLGLGALVRLSRHQRGALLFVLRADFVRTAEAKGVGRWAVLLRHALRNSLLPAVTLLGAELPVLLSGSVIVEQVFGVRGL